LSAPLTVRNRARFSPRNSRDKTVERTVHIISLGCPKNLVDSEVMAALLAADGFALADHADDAETVLINTCTFILPATEESIAEILRIAELKKEGRCRRLIVAGCLPQRYGAALIAGLPEVDLFLGTGDVPRIAELIRMLDSNPLQRGTAHIGKPLFLMDAGFPRIVSPPAHIAYLKIAEGCSNRCSYCIIPRVRGPYRSRRIDDVVSEARHLAARGVREIILTAQDTTAFGTDWSGTSRLADLLQELTSIPELSWIRLLYTYPESLTGDVCDVIASERKICPYIDLPLQHVDDGILASMGRRGNSTDMERIITDARRRIPRLALRTSLIVGFPGEKTGQFRKLLRFVREMRFDHLGVFTYSREEGTPAASYDHQVRESTKEQRRHVIMEEQSALSFGIGQSLIGQILPVMIDGPSERPGYDHRGHADRQSPEIDGCTYVKTDGCTMAPGTVYRCRITAADTYDLYAEIDDDEE